VGESDKVEIARRTVEVRKRNRATRDNERDQRYYTTKQGERGKATYDEKRKTQSDNFHIHAEEYNELSQSSRVDRRRESDAYGKKKLNQYERWR